MSHATQFHAATDDALHVIAAETHQEAVRLWPDTDQQNAAWLHVEAVIELRMRARAKKPRHRCTCLYCSWEYLDGIAMYQPTLWG